MKRRGIKLNNDCKIMFDENVSDEESINFLVKLLFFFFFLFSTNPPVTVNLK